MTSEKITNKFFIQLENGELYLMEIGYNLKKYIIKKDFLYKKHKKLGKIISIKCYEYENIKNDLEVLEAFKNSLISEYVPPKPFEPNEKSTIGDYTNYIIKFNNYKVDKDIQQKLTQWIINNIDKEKVKEWLENE